MAHGGVTKARTRDAKNGNIGKLHRVAWIAEKAQGLGIGRAGAALGGG